MLWSFLCNGTLKIPSSLNRLVRLVSKIVGKTEREKKGKSSNHDSLMIICYCISYMNYHFHVCFFAVRTETYSSVCPFAAVDSYRHFSLHHTIQFHPVKRIATTFMPPYSKRLAKVEAIPFPTSKHF